MIFALRAMVAGLELDVGAELLAGLADIELRVVVDGLDEAVVTPDGRVVLRGTSRIKPSSIACFIE